jgi:hypothetical protein
VICLDEGECVECRDCAEAGECAEELAACQADEACRGLYDCTETCEPGDNPCIIDCAMAHAEGATLFEPFAICRACQCPQTCGVACG